MEILTRKSVRGLWRLLVIAGSLWTTVTACFASDIKTDEEVVFFTTNARWEGQPKSWLVPVHGWVFERENDSMWRSALLDTLIKKLELDAAVAQDTIFRKRAVMFLVDNERNKALTVRIGAQTFPAALSEANGHFQLDVRLAASEMNEQASDGWLPVSMVMPAGDARSFSGRIQRLGAQGLSVISDIDDTVKVSNVLDKRQLLENTFVKPFVAVPGMAQAYQSWAQQGAAFHYVSSSPWQLYPAISTFFADSGLPHGSFHMKNFRVKDETFLDLFASPLETKVAIIASLLEQFPSRRFVLVGDSGEKDPEVYAEVLRRYTGQVEHVFIRNVSKEPAGADRYRSLYKGESQQRLTVFTDALELQKFRVARGK